jgi:hypothetical protein
MSYASLQYEIFCRFICAGSPCDLKLFAVQVCHLEVLGCLGREFLKAGAGLPSFLFFWPFFRKILSNMPLTERFQKIDPDLGATITGAKI